MSREEDLKFYTNELWDNYRQGIEAVRTHEYMRGTIYRDARLLFKSNPEFGQWLQEVHSAPGCVMESTVTEHIHSAPGCVMESTVTEEFNKVKFDGATKRLVLQRAATFMTCLEYEVLGFSLAQTILIPGIFKCKDPDGTKVMRECIEAFVQAVRDGKPISKKLAEEKMQNLQRNVCKLKRPTKPKYS